MKILDKAVEILKKGPICDNCLGRNFADLLSGYSNDERGKIFRNIVAFLLDSGEKVEIDTSNLYGIKFRNLKIQPKKPTKCIICKNFFQEGIEKITDKIAKKLKGLEFETFLVGSIISTELKNAEENLWEKVGIEGTEAIKSEINKEVGKRLQKILNKKFDLKNPDITIIVDVGRADVEIELRSLFILSKYQKSVRRIPQSKWVCRNCQGRGCKVCNYKGKLYPTSVQEEIERPILKATKGRESSFHGAGREDIDARNLDFRPFVIEIKNPVNRKLNLKKIQSEINKSKKVKVSNLKFSNKDDVRRIKFAKYDKTYLARVEFENELDPKKIKKLKGLSKQQIFQRTPERVLQRRADKMRRRNLKSLSWKIKGKRQIDFKIIAESGLYIKELISGDKGRTKPSVAEILDNKVKSIELDVIRIHTKGEKFG